MDPAKYWMMARRKPGDQKAPAVFSAPHITVGGTSSASYYESWEERAFAEDSAGNLGGCIWPPRSYSCSFCGREFRSAQALGGHMNVHRRDRARLKLSGMAEDAGGDVHGMPLRQGYMVQQPLPCPPTTPRPSAPSTEANPNSVRSFLPDPGRSLVDAATARTIWGKQALAVPLSSPSDTQQEYGEKERFLHDAEQELRAGGGELKLSVLGCRTRSIFEDDNEDDDENIVHLSRKRRRIDLEATQFVLCTSSSEHLQHDDPHDDGDDDNHRVMKVLKLCPSIPAEELDLELRL